MVAWLYSGSFNISTQVRHSIMQSINIIVDSKSWNWRNNVFVLSHTYMHACMHAYIHIVNTHAHIYIYIHKYMHACIRTHTHTYIHTYIHPCHTIIQQVESISSAHEKANQRCTHVEEGKQLQGETIGHSRYSPCGRWLVQGIQEHGGWHDCRGSPREWAEQWQAHSKCHKCNELHSCKRCGIFEWQSERCSVMQPWVRSPSTCDLKIAQVV